MRKTVQQYVPESDDHVRDHWTHESSWKVQKYLKRAQSFGDARDFPTEDELLIDWFVGPRYSGRSVLDVGAGPGRLVRVWSAHGVQLTSVEFSETFMPSLEALSAEFGQRCHHLDVSKDRLDGTFDLVYSVAVLLHIHPRDIRAALRNIREMSNGDALFITGGLGPPFDDEDTKRMHSFRHDYDTLFAELDWPLRLDMTLRRRTDREGNLKSKQSTNRVMFFADEW